MSNGSSSPYVIANWKMHTTLADATVLVEGIKEGIEQIKGAHVVVCPPAIWLYPIAESLKKLAGNHLQMGAQNMHWEDQGAFTGEISPLMLKGVVKYVIIGHSERRFHFQETNELVNDKVKAALRHGLVPIICVGERKKGGEGLKETLGQLVTALEGVDAADIINVLVAYEPVWAIGTGEAATGEYASEVAGCLRDKLEFLYDEATASKVPILYGGSVKGDNAGEFLYHEGIDGVLVGTASLKINEFLRICQVAENKP